MHKIYRQTGNVLLSCFMSDKNLDFLQESLAQAVRARTGLSISRQSDRDLIGIMNSVYQEHGQTACGNQTVNDLNELVLREAVPNVLSGIHSYMLYVRDASTLPEPLARSVSTTQDKSLKMNSFF